MSAPDILIPQTYYLVMEIVPWEKLAVQVEGPGGQASASLAISDAFDTDFSTLGYGFAPVFKSREAAEGYIDKFLEGQGRIQTLTSVPRAS